MTKSKKKGWYEHFCVLIFAQGTWNEKDREEVISPLRKKRDEKSDNPYPFFLKLTHRKEPPEFPDCEVCHLIYELLKEFWSPNDGILYQGHHYLVFEDDVEDFKDMANIILSSEKVKKFFVLYIKGFSEIKTTLIRTMNLTELKEKLDYQT